MMSMLLLDEVRTLLSHLGTEGDLTTVGNEDSLLESGVLDSAAMVELIMRLEDRFGIAIDEDDLVPENFDSIAAITAFLEAVKADQ